MKRVENLRKIEQAGVIAVVRADSADKARQIVDNLVAGGVTGIELTFTVPQADKLIAELVEKYADTDVIIGAGTVLDAITARMAIIAGAEFIVAPSCDKETARLANLYQVPYMAGALTIHEMQEALSLGVDVIKLFPGSEASPAMIKAVKAPLPQINIMPTGGVDLDNMADWFEAGAVAVGVGGSLLKPADTGNWDELKDNARAYMNRFHELVG